MWIGDTNGVTDCNVSSCYSVDDHVVTDNLMIQIAQRFFGELGPVTAFKEV